MIGKTNIPMGMLKGETVSILLKTNQSSNEDLNGVKVVVSYDDESHEYAYNSQFSVEIPKDKTYTVTFGEVDGYKTPSSVTYTATQGFSRSIEVTYYGEKVTVDVSAEGGASVDGQAVIVETGVPSEGVYIEDTSHKLWTTDEWDNSATANSIVVSDGSMAKRVSLTNGSKGKLGYFQYNSALPAIGTQEEAVLDMNGKENTSLLKEEHMSAASETNKPYSDIYYAPYSFPDGSKRGYVPSLGELIFLYQYHFEIDSALDKCGAEAIIHSFGTTSVQYRMYSSTVRTNSTASTQSGTIWTIDWDSGYIYYYNSTGSSSTGGIMVRPIADYDTSYTITNGKASFSVPYDETYTVSLSDMDGYTTPESQSYTASQPTREISMEYKKAVEHVIVNVSSDDYTYMDGYKVYVRPNVPNGVYIQDVDGNLYTESEWDTMKVANGIAVVTDECSFVIALEDARENVQWSEYGYARSLTMTTDSEEAVLDFNGLGNTNNMISTAFSKNNAAQYCRDYIFPNGQIGYLGAAGEWNAVMNSFDEIEELLSIIGGESFKEDNWTSTEYDEGGYVYSLNIQYLQFRGYTYNSNGYVRAFAELGSSYTITNGKVEFDVPPGTSYTIRVEDVDGYTTPEPQSFVAGVGTRTVDMVYEAVKLGVFIQGVSGKLYETDSWTSQETPNGVAVLTENCRFVIALEPAYSSTVKWASNNYISPEGVTLASSLENAKLKYDGKANTDASSNSLSSEYPAFYRCRTYSFPNGQKGYLGAAGEWQAVLDNYGAITSAYSLLGLTFTTGAYWTSTRGSASTQAWKATVTVSNSNRILGSSGKTSSYFVLAFTTI